MNRYDVLVIGAGLGGLVSAARLSKAGKRVLVLEQHSVPGGCATTFRRKDLTIEVGLHEMDGWRKGSRKHRILADLGVFDRVTFVKVPEFYRFRQGSLEITVPDDFDAARETFSSLFPRERKGIDTFFRVIAAISREIERLPRPGWKTALYAPVFPLVFRNLVFRERQNLGDFLDSIISDETLKLALCANLAYYHDDPYTLSLLYYSVAQRGYFRGGYYIRGGSQKLSDALADVIREHGGELVFGRTVTEILVSAEGTAVGVKHRGREPRDEETAWGGTIVANAAVPNVLRMLPDAEQARMGAKTRGLQQSCSIVSLYLGFGRLLKDLQTGCGAYSTFDLSEGIGSLRALSAAFRGNIAARPVVLCDYSRIDSGLAPPGKSVATICAPDYYDDWAGLDREAYRKRKEDVSRALMKRLETLAPGAGAHVIYRELGTPKTVERYTLNPQGSVYGYAQLPAQAGRHRLSNRTPIPGLFLASAWAMPGGGFTGAMMSGNFCAEAVLARR